MTDVRRDGHDLGEAQAHQLRVDHRGPDPDVGEQAAVPVARLNVDLEPHALALDELAIHRVRLGPTWLLAPARLMHFRGVHADVAYLLEAVGEAHVDGVAVHD